ncbi:MAG: DNA repair protein RecN [Gammaproteobacteria bacterium]|nr:DNA repair protein RecN [Gammaproteobacteria bacterium]MDH3905054.1 DNA repair protein RecN [Gammaproteobacteria bacterium]
MLVNLQVRDFAIVDRIAVEFEPGMTVLTGETGAGKSILVDALGLVLGERGGSKLVRSGAKRAEFSAEFDLSGLPRTRAWLEEQALDEDDQCLLRRVVNSDGRSRAFINGNAVPVQQLKTLGEMLIDIHGQHFHQSLGRRAIQRDLLDHYGGLQALREQTANAFTQWRSLLERLEALQSADADRASRVDLLTFQLQEIESLDAQPGEYSELQAEAQRLANSGRLAEGVAAALDSLSDNDTGNAASMLASAERALQSLVEFDEELSPVVELLDTAGIQVAEASDSLRRYGDSIDMDPGRQDLVEQRLDSMQSIARKHRVEPGDLPDLRTRLSAELDELTHAEERGRELEQEAQDAEDAFRDLAGELSRLRKISARKFASAVSDAMAGLGMPGGKFEIALEPLAAGTERASGLDDIEFLISANPGQPAMPLSKVASGGELSRMSLSIQVIASDGSTIPTMVFDEVDSGVGGGVAEMVGRRLAEVARDRQVLCVTHLPQVASLANHHIRISKVTDGKATRTGAHVLDQEERVDELARMLGGVQITAKTREHAAEMLAGAPQKRA